MDPSRTSVSHALAADRKMVSTFTAKDPKIEAVPTGDQVCRHTKARGNLSVLLKNKTIKGENTKEPSVTVWAPGVKQRELEHAVCHNTPEP